MVLLLKNSSHGEAHETGSDSNSGQLTLQPLGVCDTLHNRLWPTQDIQQYAIQCARCGKYRKVPSKEEYEILYRRQILNPMEPWLCEHASKWGEDMTATCESQDQYAESPDVCFFMDKCNYPPVPSGWERIITVRSGLAAKGIYCDVYYRHLPLGRKLRTLLDIEKYVILVILHLVPLL
ncbi:hypothetical protein Mapa_008311 [Marchantia paleacea]|nr:hypothetical protein Mapa_008311 [Marchantia paleacea]